MRKKDFLWLTAVVFVFLVGIVTVNFLPSNEQEKTITSSPTVAPLVKSSGVIVDITLNPVVSLEGLPVLELSLKPKKENVHLSAFALKATLEISGNDVLFEQEGNLTPNPELKKDNWSFPFATYSRDEKGSTLIRISGIHVGSQPFNLKQRVVLATIPLSSIPQDQLEFSLDAELTEFLTSDALTEIPFTENNNQP